MSDAITVSMLVRAAPERIYAAFVEPPELTRFWLTAASAPLALGAAATWDFMVPGARIETEALLLDPPRAIRWRWSDGSEVAITLRAADEGTIVRIEHGGFTGSADEIAAHRLDSTEGFTIVLCDLKTLLETGTSTGLVRDKARLIERGGAG